MRDRRPDKLERAWHEGLLSRRDFVRQATLITGSFAAAMNFLTACGGSGAPLPAASQSASTRAAKTTLTIAGQAVIPSLDYIKHTATNASVVGMHMLDPLVMWDVKERKYVPWLATEWKALNDTTWEFKLRKEARFTNGDPVRAEDVKFSFERALDPKQKSPRRPNYSWIKSIEAPDDLTVRLITDGPYPIVVERMSIFSIESRKFVTDKGDDYIADHVLGSGPYKLVEWKRTERLTMEVNPEWWGGTPPDRIKTIHWRAIPEEGTAIAELINGGVDFMFAYVPPDQADVIKANPNLKVVAGPINRSAFLMMDGTGRSGKSPFTDVNVRRAVNHAVNTKELLEKIFRGYASPSTQPLVSSQFGYDPGIKPYEYDVEKAKKLLSEAGAGSIETNLYYYADEDLATALQGYLGKINIKVSLKDYRANSAALTDLRRSGKIDSLASFSWGSPRDADQVLYSWFRKGAPEAYNFNDKLDKLLDDARNTIDQEKRKQLYSEAEKNIVQNAYWVPLVQKHQINGAHKDLQFEVPDDELPRMWDFRWKG